MDNIRLLLTVTLFFILLLMYQAWETDYAVPPTPVTTTSTNTTNSTGTQTETPDTTAATPSNAAELPTTTSTASAAPDLPMASTSRLIPSQGRINVETDVLKIELDTLGGDVRRIFLKNYPVEAEQPDIPFRLLNDSDDNIFVAQSGLLPKEHAPTHQAVYTAQQRSYTLADGSETVDVVLTWKSEDGIEVDKIYTFKRGKYDVSVKHIVRNNSSKAWEGRIYGQLQRTEEKEAGQSQFIYTYMGGAISSKETLYEKISFEDMRDGLLAAEKRSSWKEGWAAMIQHYFVSAWVPQKDEAFNYYTNVLPQGQRYVIGLYGSTRSIAAGTQDSFDMTLYMGPKLQDELAELATGLELTVDYGWLWFIAQPIFWLLTMLHGVLGNWGWAIIFITIIIKAVFFNLSATSYKSMANMRRLQPRLIALKERYSNDKARLNQAMMDMYKKEKINPLGGCLPILIQIPVFIALYWVLLESVELRQADFMLWWTDLSSPDPYFVLPLVMGATMFLQQRLNPAPLDPVQQKVMMLLPIIFTAFFAFFPAGLVLYWVVNNILSIAQQWVITRKIAGDV